jgi:twitching motility protein PilT
VQAMDLLKEAVRQRASDIHLVPGVSPLFRIDGQLLPLPNIPSFTADDVQQFVLPLLNERQRTLLAKEYCVDFSLNFHEARFRGNAVFQRNGLEVIFRLVPVQIPTPEDLLLPPVVSELANMKSGLVLITGATGSGKSTTLACLINLINERRRGNIITIEDPIEFVHGNKNCVVSQREIGSHATAFGAALRFVMRQDPDVVMVGEMRDLETISAVVTLAETGHLVLATLHSNDAAHAIDRMIDVFPERQQQQIRIQLAGVLRAVVAQTLMPRAQGRGRVAMREIMVVNSAISNLIRTAKTHEIYSAIEMGAREGMVSSSRALADLMAKGLIDQQQMSAQQAGVHTTANPRRSMDFGGPSAAA